MDVMDTAAFLTHAGEIGRGRSWPNVNVYLP